VICRSCQRDNRAGRRFCGACGGNLEPVCGGCGFVNEADDRFCGGCGASMSNLPGVAQILAPPPATAAAAPQPAYATTGSLARATPAPSPATHAMYPATQAMPTLHAPPHAARTTQVMPWPDDELAGLFTPPALPPAAGAGAALPEIGIGQDDLDRLFGNDS